jgi:hypothetical protein
MNNFNDKQELMRDQIRTDVEQDKIRKLKREKKNKNKK